MEVETKRQLEGFDRVKGVHDLYIKDKTVYFQVDSEEINNVIKFISPFEILRLESAPPTLEDLFMRHYRGEAGDL
jgi:ABC-2 type transport system ATP-binding protein